MKLVLQILKDIKSYEYKIKRVPTTKSIFYPLMPIFRKSLLSMPSHFKIFSWKIIENTLETFMLDASIDTVLVTVIALFRYLVLK